MIDEWDLSATNLGRLAQRQYEVAVIPVGAIEAHNRHLPRGPGLAPHDACCPALLRSRVREVRERDLSANDPVRGGL